MNSSNNITWVGTFTPSSNVEDTSNLITLSSSYTDTLGNSGISATTSNYVIDTKSPSVSSFTSSNSTLIPGETATVSLIFSDIVSNFNNSDISVANGTLSTMNSSNNITWVGTFTP